MRRSGRVGRLIRVAMCTDDMSVVVQIVIHVQWWQRFTIEIESRTMGGPSTARGTQRQLARSDERTGERRGVGGGGIHLACFSCLIQLDVAPGRGNEAHLDHCDICTAAR